MANVFDVAMGALFRDANMATSAVYRSRGFGAAQAVKVLLRAPDVQKSWGDTLIGSTSTVIEVRCSEIALPAAGDQFDIDGVTYAVQGEPARGDSRLIWTVELVPLR